jgi:altronate hydrolase
MSRVLHIHPDDNVANALSSLNLGEVVDLEGETITVCSSIPMGHKVAIREIPEGQPVIKYGKTIGLALKDIRIGEHVHVENVKDPISNWKAQYALPSEGGNSK